MAASVQHIDYDTEPIRSAAVRRSVDSALDRLKLRKREGVWAALSQLHGGFPRKTTVVVADLHQLEGVEQLDYWSAGPSSMSFVFLVRSELDRRRLSDPEFAVRLNDERFFVFDLACAPSGGVDLPTKIDNYFRTLVDRLEPDRIRLARFAAADGLLWVEFSDGFERAVAWTELPFAKKVRFAPTSASASGHGQSVLFLDSGGRELDVDAGALRMALDPEHRAFSERQDSRERETMGHRLRQLREASGLSQEELSVRSGIPQESLSRLENGRRDPRLNTLRKLAAGHGLELPELLARLG